MRYSLWLLAILIRASSAPAAGSLSLPPEPGTSGCDLSMIGGTDRSFFDAFDKHLRSAAAGTQARDFVPLLKFPLRVNKDGGSILIKDEAAFLAKAADILTKEFRDSIARTETYFCTSGGLAYARGALWVSVYGNDGREPYLIHAINLRSVDPASSTVVQPQIECLTPKHLVKVDRLQPETLRYRSWNRGHSTEEKPDLELTAGTLEIEGTGQCSYRTFIFKNGSTSYQVADLGCSEKAPPKDAMGQLTVQLNNKVLGRWWCTIP